MRSAGMGGSVAAVWCRAKTFIASASDAWPTPNRAAMAGVGATRFQALKEIEDKLLGGIALIMLLPLMAIISGAIALESPGPVLFRQQRRGRGGQPITVLKFRTMYAGSECAGFRQAVRDDPRVTRVGRILRRSSLDELPQLFNVLNGSMSLIGPRPHPLELDEQFGQAIPGYYRRLAVKPGITGLAQIRGFRGETPTMDRMKGRIENDLRYIAEWSLLLDLKILLVTPFSCLVTEHAY